MSILHVQDKIYRSTTS